MSLRDLATHYCPQCHSSFCHHMTSAASSHAHDMAMLEAGMMARREIGQPVSVTSAERPISNNRRKILLLGRRK